MARTTETLESTDNSKNMIIIEEILKESEFEFVEEKGEEYWENSQFPAHPCIKYTFDEDKLIIEGWVKNFTISPSVKSMYSEKDLSGRFIGGLPKKFCRKVIDNIKIRII